MISEPMTLATDYLLALAALAGALALWRSADRGRGGAARLWAGGFFAIGLAATLGGTWHGFAPRLSALPAALLWKATLAAAGCASFFLVAGAAFGSVSRRAARRVTAAAAVKLGLFLLWVSLHDDYGGVLVDSAVAMAAVVALQLHARARRSAPSAPWILAGIALSLVAAGIEALGYSPLAPGLSHNDLYHLVQIAALFLLYRGGRLFRPVEP